MAMSAEQRSKYAALHRQWWRLQVLKWDDKPQANKQINNRILFWLSKIKLDCKILYALLYIVVPVIVAPSLYLENHADRCKIALRVCPAKR